MKILLNKKAVLFSLISVLFSILFITIFSSNFNTATEDRIPGSNIRIKVMDTYTRNFETYIGDSLKTSTYLTLNAITIYRRDNGRFFSDFSDFNTTFYNCMTCGYVNCASQIAANNCSLGKEYFNARLDNIIALSNQQLNIKTEYRVNSIHIITPQTYPFEIDVEVNISYNITDNSSDKYAKWTKQKLITQTVSIIGLIDPYGYLNDSTNTYKRAINQSIICEDYDSCTNYVDTQQFYQESSFRKNKNSTSFLQRYWNDPTISYLAGIETILHPGIDLDAITINKDTSYIDHYYWNTDYTCDSGKKIVNVTLGSDDIHLDESTAARYGLTDYSVSYCPK